MAVKKIRNSVSSAETFHQQVPSILKTLAEALECSWCVYWAVDRKAGVLKAAELWHQTGKTTSELERETLNRTLTSGEGLPGRAWRTSKVQFTDNVARDDSLPRSLKADTAGLINGLWIPIMSADTTYGVIELLCCGQSAMKEAKRVLLGELGSDLGNLIHSG